MAVTINNFWGAETGGVEETYGVGGTSGASSAQKHTGTYSYYGTGVSGYVNCRPFETVADAGQSYIIGFWVRFSDVTPDSVSNFCGLHENSFQYRNAALALNTDGALRLYHYEFGGTYTTLSASPGFVANTWHFVEWFVTMTDTGSSEVFVDGTSVGSASSVDLDSGTGGWVYVRLSGMDTSITVYFDDIYFMSGCTSAADRLGGSEVHAYRSSKASITPDDGGNDLNAGSGSKYWSYMQEIAFNDTNWAGYNTAGQAGAVNTDDVGGSAGTGGPNTDANITGTISGIKGVWRADRNSGLATDHYGLLGNSVDGTTRTTDLSPGVSPANYTFVSESASIVPTASEYCQIGIECTGASIPQGINCYDMLAQVLHVPAVGGGFPYHVRRIKRDNMRTLINL